MVIADTVGAGNLFQKEENDDTEIGPYTIRKGKIRLKSLVVEYR